MLTFPTAHLNGTSKDDLFGQYYAALQAVKAAEAVIKRAYPHARDYYTQGAEAFNKAVEEHSKRVHALRVLSSEFEQILSNIQEQTS